MAQFIDKTALVAWAKETYLCENASMIRKVCYKQLLEYINTLEVKEMDLEKEFDDYTKDILACDVQFEPFTHLHKCAKYFYELGLKAKGE